MGAALQNTLVSLETKLDEIVGRYLGLKADNERLEQENAALREELAELHDLYTRLGIENESLRVSHKLAPGADDVVKARRLIAGLVRDIDKCISQLKE